MKIIILGGFLGSGKTSVLMRLASKIAEGSEEGSSKLVIIENEVGEIGVDDKLLKTGGYKVENMFSGCVCCSMAGEIISGIVQIQKDFNPEYLIIESSGVGYPNEIKENIKRSLGIDSKICTLIDAKRWKRILIPMQTMLKDQIVGSDYILVNKTDLVDAEMLDFVDKSAQEFVPEAKLFNICAMKEISSDIISEITQ